jgi:predicted alpha-1,6-mannanase (GH76 family)
MTQRAALGMLATATLALSVGIAAPAAASTADDADQAFDAFVDAFWDPAKNYFFTNSDHVIDPAHAFGPEDGLYTDFWWEAQLWETVMDAYQRTGDAEQRQMIDDVYDGFVAYHPGFENNFNDDIGWWAQGAIRAYALTEDCRYLERSKQLFDGIWAEWDSTYGGGIWWRKDPRDQKNVATNAPASLTATRLYQATGDAGYLDKAAQLFDWVDANLQADGHVYDHLEGPGDGTLVKWDFTYNFGNYIGAATALYEATADAAYLHKAIAAADWATTYLTNGGTFHDEGINDGAGFKTILIRHLTYLATVHDQPQYLPLLQANVTQAWDHRRASDGLVGWNWSAPTEAGRLQSLTAAAAVSAMQVVPSNGYSGPQPGTGIHDAENAVTTSLGAESSSDGFLGRGYLAGWNTDGQAVTFSVNTAAAGAHELRLRYAAAAGEATRRILVNGAEVGSNHRFPGTGSWSAWAETDLDNVNLLAGHNTIRVEYAAASGSSQFLNLDRLIVSRQLEAESGVRTGVDVETNPNGHTGDGYLAGWNGDGQGVDLAVTVERAGRYDLTLRYAAGAGDASRHVSVNGNDVSSDQTFPGTGSWDTWQSVTVPDVPLASGDNTISLVFDQSEGSRNWLNLDHLTLRYVHDEPAEFEAREPVSFPDDACDEATDGATAPPAKGVLSSDNGWDTGLHDGSYVVTMNLWWGSNAGTYRLYENGELLVERTLTPSSPNRQQVAEAISGRPNGEYVYTAELVNSQGTTQTAPLTVPVRDAEPAAPVLSSDNTDRDGDYTLTANLWWGTNATSYRFLEGSTVIAEGPLTDATPSAQAARHSVVGSSPGEHTYTVEFANSAGTTSSAPITVTVAPEQGAP